MNIRQVLPTDLQEWSRLRNLIWPEDLEGEHSTELEKFFAGQPVETLDACFVCDLDGRLQGFVEVSIRSEAPGCNTDRIGYLEGLYVQEGSRHLGIARELVNSAETWARSKGCTEMASDTTDEYSHSPDVHYALGYQTVEWRFRKALD